MGIIATEEVSCNLCASRAHDVTCITRDFCCKSCDNEFKYVKCRDCGHVYLHNRPVLAELDTIYPETYQTYHYDEYLGPIINWARNLTQSKKIAAVKKYAREGDLVVDVGCGGGHLLLLAKKYGLPSWRLCGVDFSEKACAAIRKRGLEAVHGRFETLDWDLPAPGVVVMNQLIEHVEAPNESFAKAFEILRPGGVLILETPNLDSWDCKLFHNRYWGGWHAPRHWNLFTASSLARLARAAEFEIASIEYILNPFAWIHSVQYVVQEKTGSDKIAKWFDVNNFLLLCIFSMIDTIQIALTGKSSNLRLVVRKPVNARVQDKESRGLSASRS